MSQEVRSAELREKSQKLVDGPLKHIRAAALAAALVPLASVMATPASAQTGCDQAGSGGFTAICGTVFNDLNHDGIQQSGEPGLSGVEVFLTDTTGTFPVFTGPDGSFTSESFSSGEQVTVGVTPPTGFQVSPVNPNCMTTCNSGTLTNGVSSTTISVGSGGTSTSFGFFENAAPNPGTGTIGYWKNHPEAWPGPVTVAGKTYTVNQAIALFNKVGKDKSYMMFAQLVAAKLSVQIGNDSSCIAPTIVAANNWLVAYPVGSNVAGSSYAWSGGGNGATIEQTLDAYNNGQLCAPHRQ